MSDTYGGGTSYGGGSGIGTGYTGTEGATETGETGGKAKQTAQTAKEQAANVGSSAADAGKHVAGTAADDAKRVAGTAKQEAKGVVGEATSQVKSLAGQAGAELRDQAEVQQQKAASGIRSLGDELRTMASNSEQDGAATKLVREVGNRAGDVASWLDARDPASLLDEVKQFARRSPGTFIAIAAVAGVVVGRLTRSVVQTAKEEKEASQLRTSTTGPEYGTTDYYTDTTVTPGYTGAAAGAGTGVAAGAGAGLAGGSALYDADVPATSTDGFGAGETAGESYADPTPPDTTTEFDDLVQGNAAGSGYAGTEPTTDEYGTETTTYADPFPEDGQR